MGVLTWYYYAPAGRLNGRLVGEVLNRDGTVYNANMTEKQTLAISIPNNAPLIVADKLKVNVVGDADRQRIEVLVLQQKDIENEDSLEVVASLRLDRASVLQDLREQIKAQFDELKEKAAFPYFKEEDKTQGKQEWK